MQQNSVSALLVLQCPRDERKPFTASNKSQKRQLRRQTLQISAVLGAKQDTSTKSSSINQSSYTSKTGWGQHEPHHKQVVKVEQALELFPDRHMTAPNPLLYAYFPFGVAIAGVRMLMWLCLLTVDQAWLTDNDISIAILQAILGVQVKWKNVDRLPEGRYVMVSNHITTGDMMALYCLPTKTIHLISSQLPDRIAQSSNHRIDFRHASVGSYDLIREERQRSPIHLFPEGGMTNGRGMMKFNKGFMRFSEGLPVVPIALRAQLPWGILTHTLHSSFLSNLFWFCFSPYVSLEMSVLPPAIRAEGESKAKFVERIQQKIADELQVPIIDFTLQAKKQLMRSSKPGQ